MLSNAISCLSTFFLLAFHPALELPHLVFYLAAGTHYRQQKFEDKLVSQVGKDDVKNMQRLKKIKDRMTAKEIQLLARANKLASSKDIFGTY